MATFSSISSLLILSLLIVLVTADNHDCVKSCHGKKDGDYQSCVDCKHFVECSNGYMYQMPCPPHLVWDDAKKRCQKRSTTCKDGDYSDSSELPTSPSPVEENYACVKSCAGKPNGLYQSCLDCHHFVTCAGGLKYEIPCVPDTLLWDDKKKKCQPTSSTCKEDTSAETSPTPTPTVNKLLPCVSSCKFRLDGDYQSCHGCQVYLTCSNFRMFNDRPCPANLTWDDSVKRCEWYSKTCVGNQYNVTVCENNKKTAKCPVGQKMHVFHAKYGRTVPYNDTCPPKGPAWKPSLNCTLDVTKEVQGWCENKSLCVLYSDNKHFPKDPCPYTYKYLIVVYSCMDR